MISIFAKEAFLNTNPHEPFKNRTKPVTSGHLQRVSSIIRGDQIAEQLGAKLNPSKGYENDVCIYVKPHVKAGEDFTFDGKPYIDVVDGWGLLPLLKRHPWVGAIACSQQDYEKLSDVLPNKVVLIPQHHCNFERLQRQSLEIKKVGVIGTEGAFPLLPKGLEEALKERGIELVKFSKFFDRGDILNFYMDIDVQIVWRPYRMKLSNSLKIVNAASFGIPTIAYDESVFQEVPGCYLPVRTLEDFLGALDRLIRSSELYSAISDGCLMTAERYHISNIAKLYKELDE